MYINYPAEEMNVTYDRIWRSNYNYPSEIKYESKVETNHKNRESEDNVDKLKGSKIKKKSKFQTYIPNAQIEIDPNTSSEEELDNPDDDGISGPTKEKKQKSKKQKSKKQKPKKQNKPRKDLNESKFNAKSLKGREVIQLKSKKTGRILTIQEEIMFFEAIHISILS